MVVQILVYFNSVAYMNKKGKVSVYYFYLVVTKGTIKISFIVLKLECRT